MIFGLGIDSVEIDRFIPWTAFPEKMLLRVFSAQEIDYCLQAPHLAPERFAVRFAAREAFYKALHPATQHNSMPLLTLFKAMAIGNTPHGAPYLDIDWPTIEKHLTLPKLLATHLSLTHTKALATAIVIIEV
jgi:holo-[acyl-carrier protein] synthase